MKPTKLAAKEHELFSLHWHPNAKPSCSRAGTNGRDFGIFQQHGGVR